MIDFTKTYINDGGYKVDATKIRKELAEQAIERCYDEQGGKTPEAYMEALYPNEHN